MLPKTLVAVLLVAGAQLAGTAQTRSLKFGVPVESDVRSGEVQEWPFTAAAGDLVAGMLGGRGSAIRMVGLTPSRSAYVPFAPPAR